MNLDKLIYRSTAHSGARRRGGLTMSGLPNPLDPGRRVSAVLFDLDGTLYRQRPLRAFMLIEMLTLPLSARISTLRHLRALWAYRRALEHLRGNSEGIRIADAQLEAAAQAGDLSPSEARRLIEAWMFDRPLKYLRLCRVRGVTELLDLLERRSVRAGILSDYFAERKLQALGIAARFSPVLVSTQPDINALKPSPRGFLRACEIWQLPPSEVLMVGDRAKADAAGAAAAGMPCVIIGRRSDERGTGSGHLALPSLESLLRILERA